MTVCLTACPSVLQAQNAESVCTSHRPSEWQNLSVQLCFLPNRGLGEGPGTTAVA